MNICENLSAKQINLLKAISKKEEQISSVSVIKKYDLGTSGTVVKNRNVLAEKDIIDVQENKAEFLDPVFELWFRRMYFNKDYI